MKIFQKTIYHEPSHGLRLRTTSLGAHMLVTPNSTLNNTQTVHDINKAFIPEWIELTGDHRLGTTTAYRTFRTLISSVTIQPLFSGSYDWPNYKYSTAIKLGLFSFIYHIKLRGFSPWDLFIGARWKYLPERESVVPRRVIWGLNKIKELCGEGPIEGGRILGSTDGVFEI